MRFNKIKFKENMINKLKSCVPAALFLSFMIGFFGPVQLYLTNASEFYFDFSDIKGSCVKYTILLFAVLSIIMLILPEIISRWISSFVFGVSLALYIQGNYITTNYGTLNGETVDWSAYKTVSIWNTFLWIACIIIPLIITAIKPKISRVINMAGSLWIVAIQVVTLIVLFSNVKPKTLNNSDRIFTNEGKYTVSSENNVCVFILDCYDSKEFNKFIEEHPEYKNELFTEFTYYPNTVGGSTRTVLALPHILTGKPYIDEKTYLTYLNESYNSTVLYDDLEKSNYDTRIYTESTFAPSSIKVNIDNLYTGEKKVADYNKLNYCMYKFTACKYFPHILKKYVWMYSGDFDEAAEDNKSDEASYTINDAAFYKNLKEDGLVLRNDKNAFRLYHLKGAHPSYTLKSDATSDGSDTSFEEQQQGVMTILNEYFKQMKDLGIYDNSTIIICSDHGEGGVEYNPLFMVKKGMETNNYTISELPVSYDNLQPTILAAIGNNNTGVKSIWELTMDDNAERYFYFQETVQNKAIEYKITGTVGKNEEVIQTGRTFDIFKSTDDGETPQYSIGEELSFGIEASGNAYAIKGLSKNEDEHTWTDGHEVEFDIPLSEIVTSDIYVKIKSNIIIGDVQRVGVSVNGEFLNWYAMDSNELIFKITMEHMKNSQNLDIKLELPDALSFETDHRTLGIALKTMTINYIDDDFIESRVIDYNG